MTEQKSPSKTEVPVTALGSVGPPTEEDSRRLAAERRTLTLEWILMQAHSDKNFARVLCETLGQFARDDAELVSVMKKSLGRERRGRPEEWNLARYEILIVHYAFYIAESKGSHLRAQNDLIEYERRMTGVAYSATALDNRISKGIKALQSAGRLEGLLNEIEWLRVPIQSRISRGAKTRRQTPKFAEAPMGQFPAWLEDCVHRNQ